ncbi:MAG TPA: hypothetical protein DCS07_04840 [Bdellovibrionales bacterium]|nr:MAG: hypothetical protein A2Z97_08240 [Bdellovibrionales bacterium GWB1_52_6]OFZ02994.1 MAG: hypothetical protein A2X97_12090 [Bdellovibrionales bacterium GWA1_52_35]HAR41946.1 hypothetical protein [Bdellovibrionales bacterium]HCM38800.1 hypothetical protein [Bdellovibrionales bacterium]
MNLKQQLRHYLAAREMTAADLAKQAGMPKQTVSDWLSGVPPRSLDKLRKVCLVLNVSLDELCFGDCKENRKTEVKKQEQQAFVPEALILPINGSVSGLFEVRIRRVR